MKKALIILFSGIIVIYLLISFIHLTLNPAGWHIISRICFVISLTGWLYLIERQEWH